MLNRPGLMNSAPSQSTIRNTLMADLLGAVHETEANSSNLIPFSLIASLRMLKAAPHRLNKVNTSHELSHD